MNTPDRFQNIPSNCAQVNIKFTTEPTWTIIKQGSTLEKEKEQPTRRRRWR